MNTLSNAFRHVLAGLAGAACIVGWCAAQAQTTAPLSQSAASPAEVGDATRELLRLQRAPAGTTRPISGDVAGLSYERYLNSFKHPIPLTLNSAVRKQGAQ